MAVAASSAKRTPATPAAMQSPLGVAGKDNAGYPNGRRPGDDVVDLSLRVAMGALCVLTGETDTLQVGCKPSDAKAGGAPLTEKIFQTFKREKGLHPGKDTD